jgi:hypothetical protein
MPGALRKLDAVALEQAKRPRVQVTEYRTRKTGTAYGFLGDRPSSSAITERHGGVA